MSIKLGDVVIEKDDPNLLEWTVFSIYDNPQNLDKVAMLKRFRINDDNCYELTAKYRIPVSDLKKVD